MNPDHDVIIVGARPTGASLAIRLGRAGHSVLLLEQADLSTRPHVPSCPTLHMGTLAMLDELGLSEQSYAAGAVKFERFVLNFGDRFVADMRIPPVHGRDYGLSIERAVFDHVLAEMAAATPNVVSRRFTVKKARIEGDLAVVEGTGPEPETLRARWLVGADGRFSLVARELGAAVTEEITDTLSTVYFTDWEGVAPLHESGEDVVGVFATGRGRNVLCFPLPDGKLTICVHERADRVKTDGDPMAYYRGTLDSLPTVKKSLANAKIVDRLLGLKKVGNGYRVAAGPHWALAGDAYHYKDPVDGQGIYDALLGTRILAEELDAQLRGQKDPARAAEDYARRVREATHPMFQATVKRLQNELYSEPPELVMRTAMRWMLQDSQYQLAFMRFLGREVDPAQWLGPGLVLGAFARGIWRDLRGA